MQLKEIFMLFTVGYEGLNISQFISMLRGYGIKKIIDIREFPISRKPGFSKSALRNNLNDFNIEYIHLVSLGCPKPIRNAYKLNSDWDEYSREFKKYVKTQDEALEHVYQLMKECECALLCFEANPQRCHRSLVTTEMIRRYGIKFFHADVIAAKKENLELPSLELA
jgi:uncharacterized protein (DUF488 family)